VWYVNVSRASALNSALRGVTFCGGYRRLVGLVRFLWCLLICASAASAFAQTRIVDGDTIDVDGTRYRIHGIDAPERAQKCDGKAGIWDCGKAATSQMIKLAANGPVQCAKVTQDVYNRVVATCYADGMDLGEAMVATGYAWAFAKYSDIYVEQEKLAKLRGVGVWQGPAQPPWVYRSARRKPVAQQPPDGCTIKGNISNSGKIYHLQQTASYAKTRITPSKGERWFCSEAEARAAGWRAPRR
jgi:endonuclease YncB( thermonuclease family)